MTINELIWKSEIEMQKKLQERITTWKPNQSRDGYIIKAEGKFIHRGIGYLIKILRYYTHTDKFKPIGDRISDCHVVVEYPDETKPIAELVRDFNSEFLYHDTLHSFNDNQTVGEQLQICHEWAKGDIDSLMGKDIIEEIDNRIKSLQEIKNKI